MIKVLVTGGAGYIGSMLCTNLVNNGYDVTVIDLLKYDKNSISHLFFHKNFKFVKGDANNPNLIKKYIKNQNYIIPLAALVGAPLCEKFKKNAIKTNVYSIKIILKYIKKGQRIIYPTTNSGYGIGAKDKYCDENSPLNPISLYGTTKLQAESLVMTHKNSVAFRLATVFGFSYRMRTDLLVNNFVKTAVDKKKLSIFEPHFRRNYVHIKDVIGSFIFAIENFNKVKNNIYNLGLSSANLSKLMLAKKIKKHLKVTKIKIIKNRKDPDKRDYFVSNKKIEKAGFKPKTTLDTGIREMIILFKNVDVKFINNY